MTGPTAIRLGLLCLTPLVLLIASWEHGPWQQQPEHQAPTNRDGAAQGMQAQEHQQLEEKPLDVHYIEVVTASVDETCEALAKAHGVAFGDPIPELGNARTADLKGGGRIGVRAPMHDAEKPAVRPYVLVENIEAVIKTAEEAGATVMVPSMQIPGQGTIALYTLGGIEHGLWQK